MKAFEEWWTSQGDSFHGYHAAKDAWNAALLHAAEVAEQECKMTEARLKAIWRGIDATTVNNLAKDIAARLRQEVGE